MKRQTDIQKGRHHRLNRKAGSILSDVDNSKDRRKAISPESNRACTALARSGKNEN